MSFKNLFDDQVALRDTAKQTMIAIKPTHPPARFYGNSTDGIHPVAFTNPPAQPIKPVVSTKLIEAQRVSTDMGISEFGTEAGKKVAELADEILKKTTTGKMGDFGDGITQILTLTSQANADDLNIEKQGGVFGAVKGWFKKTQVQVAAQFEDTSASIEKITKELEGRQEQMRKDNEFLDRMYITNMQEYHDLGHSVEAIGVHIEELKIRLEQMRVVAQQSNDQFQAQQVNEFEQRIKRWERQMDRLKRMQHVALLTAPEIRMIQTGNVAMVEKFSDIVNTTLPAWKKTLSNTILAIRQKENVQLANTVDDKTNEFFRKASDLNKQNGIAVAKSTERSTIDIETLKHMQNNLITGMNEIKKIQEDGRAERIKASGEIDNLREQMKQEMLSWSK